MTPSKARGNRKTTWFWHTRVGCHLLPCSHQLDLNHSLAHPYRVFIKTHLLPFRRHLFGRARTQSQLHLKSYSTNVICITIHLVKASFFQPLVEGWFVGKKSYQLSSCFCLACFGQPRWLSPTHTNNWRLLKPCYSMAYVPLEPTFVSFSWLRTHKEASLSLSSSHKPWWLTVWHTMLWVNPPMMMKMIILMMNLHRGMRIEAKSRGVLYVSCVIWLIKNS